jgi:hypothetical protein
MKLDYRCPQQRGRELSDLGKHFLGMFLPENMDLISERGRKSKRYQSD